MTKEQIAAVLADHARWLRGEGGKRADMHGANMHRADMHGANMQGANMQGAYMRGADMQRAYMQGAYMRGADMRGANMQGADMHGANMRGAKIGLDHIVIGLLRRATRSDGWEFFLWHCEDGFYIKAGCRFFTMEEGRKHWKATRAGTALGDETQDILAMFAKAIKRQEARGQ